ncbi:MAG: hypothetical protein ACRCR9_03370 [Chitinophagaceae bacterium]
MYVLKLKDNKKAPIFRFSLTAENPYTFFKYNGFTPDINGIVGRHIYSMVGTYTFGLRIIY